MVFLQPVVVNDAHAADQSPAAEVRVVDRRTLEPPVWTGTMLAQGAMDQRSPFGNNAPTSNELTPRPRPASPTDNQAQVADPMSTTKIPPAPGQADAGPPPPSSGTSTATPGTEPSTATPGSTVPGSMPGANTASPPRTPMPTTTPATPTPETTPGGGSGATPPVIPDSRSVPVQPTPLNSGPLTQPVESPSSSTFPGASSGASTTR